jgi:hypothetical protein
MLIIHPQMTTTSMEWEHGVQGSSNMDDALGLFNHVYMFQKRERAPHAKLLEGPQMISDVVERFVMMEAQRQCG